MKNILKSTLLSVSLLATSLVANETKITNIQKHLIDIDKKTLSIIKSGQYGCFMGVVIDNKYKVIKTLNNGLCINSQFVVTNKINGIKKSFILFNNHENKTSVITTF